MAGKALNAFIERCKLALQDPDPQASVEAIMQEALGDPALRQDVAARKGLTPADDLYAYRTQDLTVLAAALPPGFRAEPHNHNLWSVVGVCDGQEDNEFFEVQDGKLTCTRRETVTGPGILSNPADVIHAIHNPLDTPLIAVHVYGGDLLETPRSTWDRETHEELQFTWEKATSQR